MFRKKKQSPVDVEKSGGDGEPKSTVTSTTTPAEEEKKESSNDPPPPPPVSFFRLFRFATKWEIIANCVGVVCAIAAGAAQVRLSSVLLNDLTRNLMSSSLL